MVAVVSLATATTASAAPNAAFATNDVSDTISQYTFGTNQTLVANGTTSMTGEPAFGVIGPDGKHLFVDAFSGDTVDPFRIGSAGTLTALSPTAPTGSGPITMALSPDGRSLYVAVRDQNAFTVFSVGSNGLLTQIQNITTGVNFPDGVALSPDGTSVYLANGGTDQILEYNRASNGMLTPKPTAAIAAPDLAGSPLAGLTLTPDGKNLYLSGANASIDEYSVGTGGELAPKPVASISTGGEAYAVTVSPNGRNLYATSCTAGRVYQYSIGSGGELAPLTPAAAGPPDCLTDVWMTAGGTSAYATDLSNSGVDQFDVSSTGALTPKTPASVASGGEPINIVIPPDQGPVAAFTAKAAKAGHATSFNGSSSSDLDGTVVRYNWSFGDGTTLNNGEPTPKHTYKKKGTYKVTLTVTDDSGCSTTQVFTGQTAYCNGTPAARITHTVKIGAAKLTLKVSPRTAKAGKTTCFDFTASSSGHRTSKATVKLAGHTAKTNSHGGARLCLALTKGKYTAHATKKGYVSAATRIRITAAAPVFTG